MKFELKVLVNRDFMIKLLLLDAFGRCAFGLLDLPMFVYLNHVPLSNRFQDLDLSVVSILFNIEIYGQVRK